MRLKKRLAALATLTLVAVIAVTLNLQTVMAMPLSNTPASEADLSGPPGVDLPAAPVAGFDVISPDLPDDAAGRADCVGVVQSSAYDLGGGQFLYAYQLNCHCGPNWDVGYAAAGGGLKVPLNGNTPLNADFNGNGVIDGGTEDSFRTTDFGSFALDLSNFNASAFFGMSPLGDGTILADRTGTVQMEFFNLDGIFLTGDVAGFVTNAPPTTVFGPHLGGSLTSFDLVVPSAVDTTLDKFFDPAKGEPGQGPDQIEIGQPTSTRYSYAIEYENPDPANPPTRLVDTVPAEFDVVSATTTGGTLNVFLTSKGKGKSSTKITLDLPAGPQSARIDVVVDTRPLPNGKRFKPTSCGLVPLNSSPVFVFEVDPDTGAIARDADGNKIVLVGPSDVLDIVAVEDPTNPDNDGDGIPNDVEARELGTDPCSPDTDHDGLLDGDEQTSPSAIAQILPVCVLDGSSPLLFDTDGDGLGDGEEVALGLNPGHPDMDFDGLNDGDELALGTDPLNPDSDGDGALDGQDADPLDPLVQ